MLLLAQNNVTTTNTNNSTQGCLLPTSPPKVTDNSVLGLKKQPMSYLIHIQELKCSVLDKSIHHSIKKNICIL
jgi:hypothetical protein